jgi:peroxiredoxin
VIARVAAVAAALVLLAASGAAAAPAAPGFRVKLLDSPRTFDSREMMGKKVVVVRFQASYCKPCTREAAGFARLVDRYRDRGVEFLAVHVQDTVADARRFVRAQRVNYAIALDPKLTIGNRFGFKGTPDTVVIDRKGEIVARLTGESAVTRLPRILDAALAGPR